MKTRKETESCGSCNGFYLSVGYPDMESGYCADDNDKEVHENHWCEKYEYDGMPHAMIIAETHIVDS